MNYWADGHVFGRNQSAEEYFKTRENEDVFRSLIIRYSEFLFQSHFE